MKLMARVLLIVLASCAPDQQFIDPEPVFQDMCASFFACEQPDYDSVEECVSMSRSDYDRRSSKCQQVVLELEQCIATLTCAEHDTYGTPQYPCKSERDQLTPNGCDSL